MRKDTIRRLLLVTSCAYLFVVLSFTILPIELAPELTALNLQITLLICVGGAIAAECSACYPYKYAWTSFFIPFIEVACMVYFLGSVVFQLIPLDRNVYFSILGTVFLVYCVCYFIVFEKNKNDADEINKQLNKKQKVGK